MGILFKDLEAQLERQSVFAPAPVLSIIVPPPSPSTEPARPAYTIDDAIRLMRSLPLEENEDVVVRVVRSVWATMRVSVQDMVRDADVKTEKLKGKLEALTAELEVFEAKVATHREQIHGLQAELRETVSTRERLEVPEPADAASTQLMTPPAGGFDATRKGTPQPLPRRPLPPRPL